MLRFSDGSMDGTAPSSRWVGAVRRLRSPELGVESSSIKDP
ncbi:MAG: hypothetical protein ACI9U2_005199, partial [Bradymonadia bacterium]